MKKLLLSIAVLASCANISAQDMIMVGIATSNNPQVQRKLNNCIDQNTQISGAAEANAYSKNCLDGVRATHPGKVNFNSTKFG